MKIYLLDIKKEMTDAWNKYFRDVNDVKIVHNDFTKFMSENTNIEAIVSPANSFGLMHGGYDKAIIDYFGTELMKDVQEKIIKRWCGEQPVGTSMTVPITDKWIEKQLDEERMIQGHPILIHTPTMRTPEEISDFRIIYQCMRTTLIEALIQKVDSIVIPAFGGLTGNVPYDVIAKMMYLGYKQVLNPPTELDWGYAYYTANTLTEV